MYIVIPAYKPDEKLTGVVRGLMGTDARFVIVDDGSGEEFQPVFSEIESILGDRGEIVHHAVNMGKGRAMKTGFARVMEIADPSDGVITVDADGQHLPKDCEKVIAAWREHPDMLILGSRHFTGKVPFKSWWGNGFTRIVFAVTTGVRVYDTQTGLRAFAVSMIPDMLEIKGERYDYEMAQLLSATKEHLEIYEVPIETVYIAGNKSSHFRVLKDSLLINKMIFFFMLMSFISFLVDYSTVLATSYYFSTLPAAVEVEANRYFVPFFGRMIDTHLIALVLGRIVGSTCNFLLNRNVVFKSGGVLAPIKYFLTVCFLLAANYFLLSLITRGAGGVPLWIAQLVVQAVLYPVSFILQRKFVFPNKKKLAKGIKK